MAIYHVECYQKKYGEKYSHCCLAYHCKTLFPAICPYCQQEVKGYPLARVH